MLHWSIIIYYYFFSWITKRLRVVTSMTRCMPKQTTRCKRAQPSSRGVTFCLNKWWSWAMHALAWGNPHVIPRPDPPPTPPLPPTHPPTNSWHNTTCRAEAHTFQNFYKQIVEHPPQLLAIHDVDEHSVVLLSFQRKPMGTMRYRLLEMTSSGSSTLTEQLGRRRRSKGASLIWCAWEDTPPLISSCTSWIDLDLQGKGL